VRTSCRIAGLAIVTALAACSGEKAPAVDTVAASPTVAARAPAPGDSSCPRNGLWQPCGLVDRIVHAGLSFKPLDDTMRVPFLAVPGVQYRVAATDTMVAFFFPDSAALADALAPLDTFRLAPKSDTVSPWRSAPSVIRSGNLLALYFAHSDRQIERLRLAITAGAPAPAAARP
jgi:hypothetical protein